jgi:hypothetical protein
MQPNRARCPRCSDSSPLRVHRNGFLQQYVLGYFGYYPWKCCACGSLFLFRSRGYRPRRNRLEPESGGVDQN